MRLPAPNLPAPPLPARHWFALSTLLLLLLTGCGGSASAPAAPEKPVIGVVPKGASHGFWLTVKAGAEKAAAEEGYQVEWNAPTKEIDASRQIAIVQSMVNRKLAGVAVAPVDKKALVNAVEHATASGVPVAVFDSDVDTPNRLTYTATDNREGGRVAARRLGQLLGGKGKVGVVGFMPGSASTMEREEGFLEEMKAKFPGITVLPVQFGMADVAKAMAVTENMITAHPDLNAVFADNESSATGAVQALKARQAKQIRFVSFDDSPSLRQDMAQGYVDSFVLQDPFQMGYLSVKAIALQRKGLPVPQRTDLPAKLELAKP